MSLSDDDNSSLMIAILRIKKTTFAVVRISLSYYTENIILFLQNSKGKDSLLFSLLVYLTLYNYERNVKMRYFSLQII